MLLFSKVLLGGRLRLKAVDDTGLEDGRLAETVFM